VVEWRARILTKGRARCAIVLAPSSRHCRSQPLGGTPATPLLWSRAVMPRARPPMRP